MLLSLFVSVLAFALLLAVGYRLLDQTVYGCAYAEKMADVQFASLQKYVADANVSPQRLHMLDVWCSRSEKVYLAVYMDGQAAYTSYTSAANVPEEEELPLDMETLEPEYTLRFNDGTEARAFLDYYAGDSYYTGLIVLSGIGAFLCFLFCLVALIHQKMQYIKQLKAELDILADGDLDFPVTIKGADELSELAYGIDEMRKSIASYQRTEEETRAANSRLVTAMSHDLRTPLTSLIVYLELLERGKYTDEKQLHHFICQSLEKTLQIKAMADKVFEYFLVYSSGWEPPVTEPVDAEELLGQSWGEYAFALESKGFAVSCDFHEICGTMQVNIELLRRAFDNLYSNLLKYAEPSAPVTISICREGGAVRIVITNGISGGQNKKESTNIGLHTCGQIFQYHGGTFRAEESDGRFVAEAFLPLYTE